MFHSNWPDGLYPLRKDYDLKHKPPFVKKEIKFTKVEGEGVFEIPVGPVHFVASPRHADMLLVTGTCTRNMELALVKTYNATPDPKLLVAVGACAVGKNGK